MAVDKQLLDILRCPKCKGDLEVTGKTDGLICPACRLLYPIVNDIPEMLADDAVKLDEDLKPLAG